MTPTPAEQSLLEDMKQREIHVKKRQRAADAIRYEERRYQYTLVALGGTVAAVLSAVAIAVAKSTLPQEQNRWAAQIALIILTATLVALFVRWLLGTRTGLRLIAKREARLRRKYSGDLHAGRRWMQFFYDGEDISAYVPQILHFIEQERRFDSVAEALAFAKQYRHDSARLEALALNRFNAVASGTNVAVVSSSDEHGDPSIRTMRFVKTDRPGVWFLTTAPYGPKVHDFDLGRVALVTERTSTGATISSNNVSIRRAEVDFAEVSRLYEEQVPGYSDGMSGLEMEREIVYELTFRTAKVDTWTDHFVVDFDVAARGE